MRGFVLKSGYFTQGGLKTGTIQLTFNSIKQPDMPSPNRLLLILFMAAAYTASAQDIEKTPVFNFISSSYRTMTTGDVDNNGIVDLITADEQIIWFEGTGTTAPGEAHLIEAELPEYVNQIYLQDINADGYQDIYYLLGGVPYNVGILFNPGMDTTGWEQYEMPGTYDRVIGLFDVDSDSDPDFVYEDNLSYLGYRTNDANTFAVSHSITDLYSWLSFSFAEDIDMDGDTDWVGYFSDCCTKYYSNNGNGTFTVSHASSDEYMSGIYNVDINNDGYTDIIYHSSGEFEVSYFDSINGTFDSPTYMGDFTGYPYTSTFIDMDNDGDKDGVFKFADVVPDESYYTYKWIENMGGLYTFNIEDIYLQPLISETPWTSNSRTLADITNDQLPDLIVNTTEFEGDKLLVYENGDPLFNSPDTTILPYAPVATEVLCFDMDADPDNDLVIAFDNGLLAWYEYDHLVDSFTTMHTILELPVTPDNKNIKKKDLDNDGDFDLISSFSGVGSVTYYSLNDGEGNFTNYLLDDIAFLNVWLMDADEDGDLDFTAMIPSYPSYLVYYENTGNPEALFTYVDDVSSMASWYSFVDIDLDLDGDLDMVGARDYTYQVKSFINEDGAGAYTTQDNYFTAECNDIRSLFAADFDDDGDEDIVYTCISGYTYLSRNDGGTHEQIYIGTFDPTALVDGSHTTLFDLNMDGYEDLIYNKVVGGSGYKLATGPGTFVSDYDAFSPDFGRFSNVDPGFTPDFIGIDQANLYIQYNILMLAPSFDITTPTASYLEEGGVSDSVLIVFHSIPQSPLQIDITPSGSIDAGAGEGVAYTMTIPADETALDTIVIYLTVQDDAAIEDVTSGAISISADGASWGMYTDLVDIYHTYTIADNDLGLFFSPPSISFTEGTSSDTIYAHINIITDAITNITIAENALMNSGFAAAVAPTHVLGAGINAITPFTITANTADNWTYTGDIATDLQLVFTSDDLQINGFTPTPIEVLITDNEVAEIMIDLPATTITEGIESFSITTSLTSAPAATVTIIATPDAQLDLGAGTGVAVTMTFEADDAMPEPFIINGFAVDDYDVEFTHTGLISFAIISDDLNYTDTPIGDLTVTINDNDAPQGITLIEPALDTYLEGTDDILMSIALWTNPYETVLIHAIPDATLDLGAGAGNAITISFDPTDDATEPREIYIDMLNNMDIAPDIIIASVAFTIETTDPVLFDDVINDVVLYIEDDDALQGIQIAAPLPVPYTEGTEDILMSVFLNTIPNAPVTITATPNDQLNIGAGAGVAIDLILDGIDATLPHNIMIDIVEDYTVEDLHYGEISFTITTVDAVVNALSMDNILIEITDNDAPQYVNVTYDALTHEEGSAGIPIEFALASAPNEYVTLHCYPDESLDLGAGMGAGVDILFFPDETATEPQILFLEIADNFIVDGLRSEYIIIEIETGDPVFEDMTIPELEIQIEDNDETQGVTITQSWTEAMLESDPATPLTFALWTQPNAPVTILAACNTQLDLGNGPGIEYSITFMNDDTWNIGQEIMVTPVDDTLVEGDHYALIEYTVITDDPQFDGYTIPMTMVDLLDNDETTAINNTASDQVAINPTINAGQFTIHAPANLSGTPFNIVNMAGQIVYNAAFDHSGIAAVDLHNVSSGQYWLMVQGSGALNAIQISIVK